MYCTVLHCAAQYCTVLYCTVLQVQESSFTFTNHNQLVAAVRAVNPFLARVPPSLQAEFLAASVRTLLLQTGDRDSGDTPRMEARCEPSASHLLTTSFYSS